MTNPIPGEPWIIQPSSLISPAGGPRRVPPRPAEHQEPDYLAKYDSATLFYDVFRCGRRVLAVGPPAGTLVSEVQAARLVSGTGHSSRFRSDPGLDRLGRFWASTPARASADLKVWSRLSDDSVPVGADLAEAFNGLRAVMTVSQNNDLDWVTDWGSWHARHHGANALIVYDNKSSEYSLEELWESMRRINGVSVAAVVRWPFKYGPVTRLQRFWDSDYAQRGALEHARWRLLRTSAGFLNADIDELAISPAGRSVFECAGTRPSGVLGLSGAYTYPDPATPRDRRPRHADSYWVKTFPPEMPSAPKWCAIPSRLPRTAQLAVHNVRGVPTTYVPGYRFAHLLAISTNWYGARDSFHVVPEQYEVDAEFYTLQRTATKEQQSVATDRPTVSLSAQLKYLPKRLLGFGWRAANRLRSLR